LLWPVETQLLLNPDDDFAPAVLRLVAGVHALLYRDNKKLFDYEGKRSLPSLLDPFETSVDFAYQPKTPASRAGLERVAHNIASKFLLATLITGSLDPFLLPLSRP
jgi:hypothetical protein